MLRRLLISLFATTNLPIFFIVALVARFSKKNHRNSRSYKVFWGTEALLNNHYWASATKSIFSQSIFVIRYPSRILSREKADIALFSEKVPHNHFSKTFFLLRENYIFAKFFIHVLRNASLICCSCEGFLFQHYKISGFNYRTEYFFLKLARISVAVFPYGSDSFIYSKVQNRNWLYGLMTDYPDAARNQEFLEERLKFFVRKSDLFLPGIAMFDGMGRSDWVTPSTLCIDTSEWSPVGKEQKKTFTISHAPNHRIVKGTKYVLDAIQQLQDSGHPVRLKLLENLGNQEVRSILAFESDLHVDQLFADGYGLNALESMSLGIPTISNFQGPTRDFFDRWAFTKECPIVISSENELAQIILRLMNDPRELIRIGELSREYVLKHHSYSSFSKNFNHLLLKHDKRYVEFRNLHEKGVSIA
jgi:hypothetical protein